MNASPNKNASFALSLAAIVVGMVMLAYASVPLYRLFCRVTGYGGTTQNAHVAPDKVYNRVITVRFNADTDPNLPWEFKPMQHDVKVKIGETKLVNYTAYNEADRPITGNAVYNVTPHKVGPYFDKIQCFCFTKQTLKPHERITLPVSFFIDPDILKDHEMDDVDTITLSYTFFPVKEEK